MPLKSVVPASVTRPKTETDYLSRPQQLEQVLMQSFSLTTLLLIGGLFQGTLLLLIPRFWVLLPTLLVLLARAVYTWGVTLKLLPNPHMQGAILHRTTAIVPDAAGDLPKTSLDADEQVTILLLSLRMNHPLGYFAPHLKEINELKDKMLAALDAEAPGNGFLGQSFFTGKSATGANDLLLVSYWRSLDDVLAFAAGPSHRDAWAYWEQHAKNGGLSHVGISHEVFQAPRSMYESVYINFQPTRLGATTYLRKGDEMLGGTVEDRWVSPLVDASKGRLRTSKGRLGWASGSAVNEMEKVDGGMSEKRDGYAYATV